MKQITFAVFIGVAVLVTSFSLAQKSEAYGCDYYDGCFYSGTPVAFSDYNYSYVNYSSTPYYYDSYSSCYYDCGGYTYYTNDVVSPLINLALAYTAQSVAPTYTYPTYTYPTYYTTPVYVPPVVTQPVYVPVATPVQKKNTSFYVTASFGI